MSRFAIRTEQLGKQYRLGAERVAYKTLRETMTALVTPSRRAATRPRGTVWALRDVTVSIPEGEAVGVIGRNGAGKSTLLKVLSRITEPSEGRAFVRGRVGSLLEVGTGFHNELTGRENIFLSGAILGMRRAEIHRKFDAMVEFAEVGQFVDTPLKHYSSGMYLRLAFAVAAHLEPAILMVDEVLAVGDMAFQRKCIGKMQEVGRTGQTVLFVSHDLTAISRLAPRTIVMREGHVQFYGDTQDAMRLYAGEQNTTSFDLRTRTDRQGDGLIRIHSLRFFNAAGEPVGSLGSGEAVSIAVGYASTVDNLRYEHLAIDMRFTDMLGHPITTFSNRFSSQETEGALPPSGELICHVPSLALAEDTYSVDLWCAYKGGCADNVTRAGELRVVTAPFFDFGQEPVRRKHGAALIKHGWSAAALLKTAAL